MRFSLQSREIIADSIETMTCAQYHDACIALPGCDKNMPGVVMAFARHNRPSIMIYGGTMEPGRSEILGKDINITTCYEVHGAYIYGNLKSECTPEATPEDIMKDVERHACRGVGACGGMYTANTMASCIEGNYHTLRTWFH
jgi:dihydroxy-acid dehydratase